MGAPATQGLQPWRPLHSGLPTWLAGSHICHLAVWHTHDHRVREIVVAKRDRCRWREQVVRPCKGTVIFVSWGLAWQQRKTSEEPTTSFALKDHHSEPESTGGSNSLWNSACCSVISTENDDLGLGRDFLATEPGLELRNNWDTQGSHLLWFSRSSLEIRAKCYQIEAWPNTVNSQCAVYNSSFVTFFLIVLESKTN